MSNEPQATPQQPPAGAPAPSGDAPAGDRPARPAGDRPQGDRPGGGPRGGRGGDRRGGGGYRGGGGGGGFRGRKRTCRHCGKVKCTSGPDSMVDYKDVARLRSYINERGKIETRRKLATSAFAQRQISAAVKRARFMALLPYTLDHVRESRIFPLRG